MRNLIVGLSLVLASTAAHAQTCTVAQAAENPGSCASISLQLSQDNRFDEARRLTEEHHNAVVLRNTGIAITTLSTIATVVGATLFATNICFDSCSSNQTAGTAGAGLLILGQLGVTAGIPMWAAGGAKATKTERALLTLSAGGAKLTF